jgi:hypothetical protein
MIKLYKRIEVQIRGIGHSQNNRSLRIVKKAISRLA